MTVQRSPKRINLKQQTRRVDSEEKLRNYILTQLGAPLITVDVTDVQIEQCIDDAFNKWGNWAEDAMETQVFVIDVKPEIKEYILDDRVQAIYDCSAADTTSSYGSGAGNGMWQGFPLNSVLPPMYVPMVFKDGAQSSLSTFGNSGIAMATGVAGGVTGPHTGGNQDGDMEPMYAAWGAMQTMQNTTGNSLAFEFNRQNKIFRIFDNFAGPLVIQASMDYVPNPDYDLAYGHIWIKAYALNLVKRNWGNNLGKYDSPIIGGASVNYDRIISEAQQEIDKLEENLIEQFGGPMGIFSA